VGEEFGKIGENGREGGKKKLEWILESRSKGEGWPDGRIPRNNPILQGFSDFELLRSGTPLSLIALRHPLVPCRFQD
jgi:hypothetical protein